MAEMNTSSTSSHIIYTFIYYSVFALLMFDIWKLLSRYFLQRNFRRTWDIWKHVDSKLHNILSVLIFESQFAALF